MARRESGFVDCTAEIEYAGAGSATLAGIYEAIIAGKKYVKLSNGALGEIPEAWIEKLATVFALCEKPRDTTLRVRESAAAAIAMLESYGSFASGFIKPIEKERCGPRAEFLRRLIAPCILRRTKEQVATELPPKTEIVIKVPMTPRQRTLYDMTREACRASVMNAIDTDGMDHARMHILQALTGLRQICCHPQLIDESYKGDSCKIEAVDGLLENISGEKHKALVFSQFVALLDLLRTHLDGKNIRYEYLTGQTADRRKPVDRFQENPDIPVMLISLRAGGVGLNLTAAHYVIMADPWWNPAVENQAAGRAHRIGQTKPVFVYKLIAADSVEERVLELQKSKKELFDAIITADASVFKRLNREDIERLFR
jgi:non-specific serine/threonine protein kinase